MVGRNGGLALVEEASSGVDVSVRPSVEMAAGDWATGSACDGGVAGSAQCMTESRATTDY